MVMNMRRPDVATRAVVDVLVLLARVPRDHGRHCVGSTAGLSVPVRCLSGRVAEYWQGFVRTRCAVAVFVRQGMWATGKRASGQPVAKGFRVRGEAGTDQSPTARGPPCQRARAFCHGASSGCSTCARRAWIAFCRMCASGGSDARAPTQAGRTQYHARIASAWAKRHACASTPAPQRTNARGHGLCACMHACTALPCCRALRTC